MSLSSFSWWYWKKKKKRKEGKQPSGSSKKKRQSREEEMKRVVMDKEYDVVLVPSDDSDWSIGWMEPHGPDFYNNNNNITDDVVADNSFAVLVPCYRNDCKMEQQATNQFLNVLTDFPDGFPAGNTCTLFMFVIYLQIPWNICFVLMWVVVIRITKMVIIALPDK